MSKPSMAQGKQILDLLSSASSDDVQRLIENGDLLQSLAGADLSRVDRRAFMAALVPPMESMFRTPQQLLDYFVVVAASSGYFGTEDLNRLREQMPTDFKSTLEAVLVIDIWLGNLEVTFDWLWDEAANEQDALMKTSYCWGDIKSDREHLKLLDNERYGDKPAARWCVVDLTANRGKSPREVRDLSTSAGLQVLAAAAQHPRWAASIYRDEVPAVWMPGLQARWPSNAEFGGVPLLGRHLGQDKMYLRLDREDDSGSASALPTFRDL